MRFPKFSKRQDTGQNQGLVTISLITSLTLVCMVLVLAWGRAEHNQEAELLDGNRLVAAASAELRGQARVLRDALDETLDGKPTPEAARRNTARYPFWTSILSRHPAATSAR